MAQPLAWDRHSFLDIWFVLGAILIPLKKAKAFSCTRTAFF